MLVLTRKQDEMIQIGDNIVIKVISTGRGKCKIGIEAPSDIRVVRGELSPLVEQFAKRSTQVTVDVEQGHPVAH